MKAGHIRIDITGKAPMLLLEIVAKLEISIKKVFALAGRKYADIFFEDISIDQIREIQSYIKDNDN